MIIEVTEYLMFFIDVMFQLIFSMKAVGLISFIGIFKLKGIKLKSDIDELL